MAINAIDPVSPNGVGHLACDDNNDVPNLAEYAKSNNLKLGSDCYVVDTGDIYVMKSTYEWKKQWGKRLWEP